MKQITKVNSVKTKDDGTKRFKLTINKDSGYALTMIKEHPSYGFLINKLNSQEEFSFFDININRTMLSHGS